MTTTTTKPKPSLAGVPLSVIEGSRRLRAELDARPADAPVSELGRELEAIRQKYIEEGGTFLSGEELEREIRRYRFGIDE